MDIKSGTTGSDTFDGSVNANGTATLTSVDQLNGGDGTDTLIGGLAGGNIATKLTNIETGEFITSAATTLDLVNTTGMTSLLMRNSSNVLTVNNIAATTGTSITAQDQASDFNLNFTNAALTGANAFTLSVSGAQSDASGGAVVAIAQQAGADITGLETLTIASGGNGTNFLDSVSAVNATPTNTLTTLKVTGAQGLTVSGTTNGAFAAAVRTVDLSGMTGATGLTAGFAATAAVTVTGSAGNDTLTFAANNADSSINAGAGNDVVSLANFSTADTIGGGDGTADRLDISAANAEAIVANLVNTTGFEQLSLNTAGSAGTAINATRFGSIDTVRLNNGTGAGTYGVTMQAGTVNVQIATPTAATNAQLLGALTVTDTGTAATDILNITNRDTDTVSTTDNYNGQAITSTGYETVNLSTGTTATVAQTVGVVTVNNDSLTGANTLNITGANAVTVARVDSNSSGLLTINAAGLTGTATLNMTNGPAYTVATGTASITGSSNADTLRGSSTGATSATIAGGAGNDTIVAGTAADSLAGDAGNDNITAGGGNDTVTGGDGNDTIDVTGAAGKVNVDGGAGNDTVNVGATLTTTDVDTVAGGEGTDTLQLGAVVTAASASSISGFETLSIDAAFNQGLEQFTANTGFTRVNYNTSNNVAITNASLTVDTIQLQATGANAFSFARLVDTSTNSLNLVLEDVGGGGAVVVATLTANDEETLIINTGTTSDGTASNGTGEALTITTLSANDLTTLTVSGSNAVIITNAIAGASSLATVNASALNAAFTANASTSTANLTFTGAFAASNVFTGGTGSDTLTGGTAADTITGGNGADQLNGGAGADVLNGGIGADTINGDIGNDTITGGVGNDALNGGEGADDFVFEAALNGVDTVTGFVSGTDNLNVVTNVFGGAIAGATTITTAAAATGASIFAADNQTFFLSFNGAAANLTTGAANTLSAADMTGTSAATLANLTAYLADHFNAVSGVNTNDVVVVVNWTAGSSTTSYVYEFVNDNAANALQAAEITLIGIVDRGTNVLTSVNSDLI